MDKIFEPFDTEHEQVGPFLNDRMACTVSGRVLPKTEVG